VGRGQYFIRQLAVAVEARFRPFVRVFDEPARVQLGSLVSAICQCVAVTYVDNAVAVKVFARVTDTVAVQVPAGLAVGPVLPINAINAIDSIVASATCQSKAKAKNGQEKGVPEESIPSGHCFSPNVE
jgi:hypothetical protein